MEAPAEAGHHGDLAMGQLHFLGGDHKAFVVSGGPNLDFNIGKVQLKSS